MGKLKTISGIKDRFRVTGTGKLRATQSGKRHGMIKRSRRAIRTQRGTVILNKNAVKIVKRYF
jgi:large subunit ribosomal protein L35